MRSTAVFDVRLTVRLTGVTEEELENSDVLHPAVLEKVDRILHRAPNQIQITLEEVFEKPLQNR